jgi:hypothetical protein
VRHTNHFLASAVTAGLLVAPCASRADDGIKVYTVPKDHPPIAQAAVTPADPGGVMPAADIPVNAGHVTWTTPTTWKELAPNSIRIGNFAVPGQDGAKAEVAIFSFPGAVGTELDNVNRWRNEVRLEPIGEDKIVASAVMVDGIPGKLYEINGPKLATVAVSVPRDGATWFIKLKGDKEVVADAEPVFRDFLKTIHFNAAGAPIHDPALDAAANPHGDLSGGATIAAADAAAAADQPQMAVPDNWTVKEPGPMIFKRYGATDAAGHSATITVSSFPGDVGGVFANVNRWRAQMSLQPIDEGQLPSVTSLVDTPGGPGTMVDLTGTDSRTSEPGRMVAIMVRHGDSTWFYKLTGNEAVVQAEKDKFINFVKSVRYP